MIAYTIVFTMDIIHYSREAFDRMNKRNYKRNGMVIIIDKRNKG